MLKHTTCSLLPKIDELRLLCEAAKPDITCVNKTWLNSDILLTMNYGYLTASYTEGIGIGMVVASLCIHNALVCKPLLLGSLKFQFCFFLINFLKM